MSLAKMILKRKKAVSPVIATILLIALTVTAAAIVYFVVVPMLQKKPELTIVNPGHVTGQTNQLRFTVQNIGSGEATIDTDDITLYNVTGEADLTITIIDPASGEFPISVSSQGEQQFTIELSSGDFSSGIVYEISVSGKSLEYTY
jgi:flagellin-like protein